MKNIFLPVILAGAFVIVCDASSTNGMAQTPQSYPLVCRGSANAPISFQQGRRLVLKFRRGTAPAGSGLAPGECSWVDRGMYEAEADVLVQQVREGGNDDPQYRWTSDLNDPNSYWTFDVYNDRAGQLFVLSSHNDKIRSKTSSLG